MSGESIGIGWPAIATEDYLLLAALPPLLACMAYFSLVEATYFSLTPADRLGLRRTHPDAARRIEAILASPRVLLVSDMLGALVVSTAYLVVSTVLVSRFEHSLLFSIALAVTSVLGMVLSAEVLPKIIGTTDRSRAARVTARSTAIFCAVMGPLARGIDRFVLAPIGRLTAQIQPSGVVDAAELAALLEQSAREGSIDVREREAIEGVMRLRRLRVRDVMTPRVDMAFVYVDSDDSEIVATSTRARLTHLPVVGRHVDEVVGILSLKRYLLTTPRPTRAECMEPPRFVPELASLEQLLEHFRRTGSKLAIAVDEYGGTAGIVALEDCVEEIVGDIADVGEVAVDAPLEVAAGVWRVSGEMSVARWSEIFGARAVSARSSTVAGIVLQRLSRLARTGDKVDLANVRIEVEKVEGARIRSVLVSLQREVA
jgi:CBS domain containing-hemolysin-like protein